MQSTKVIKLLKKTALSNAIQECRKDGEMGTSLHSGEIQKDTTLIEVNLTSLNKSPHIFNPKNSSTLVICPKTP